ncbi:hypothetical protein G7Z17_g6640 [Cylindrodendrum hubeiense]|uniref:Uncharacterized protein n=1 Tax=Cylindrodendrum hubeiense TaxID=595255 RepID=A0A9P5H505_9HYPO|nr:hypothetical protein G7Z17_g6640 [Cylindrodendrum hubeiense]
MATNTASKIIFVGTVPTAYTPGPACSAISSSIIVGIDYASSCLPKSFHTNPSVYYSPGWECPTGYAAPSRCTRSDGPDATVFTLTCCPARGDITLSCLGDPTGLSGIWKSHLCTWSAGTKETVLLVTSTSLTGRSTATITSAVTMSGTDGINAYGIRMVYHSSDLPATTTEITAETAAATSAATSTSTTTPSSTYSRSIATSTGPASDEDSGGLATGAIVAIAVVIPLAAIAMLIGAFFWFRRRKQREQNFTAVPTDTESPKELPPDAMISELYGSMAAPPQELPTPAVIVELPGDIPSDIRPPLPPRPVEMEKVSSPNPTLTAISKIDAVSPPLSTEIFDRVDMVSSPDLTLTDFSKMDAVSPPLSAAVFDRVDTVSPALSVSVVSKAGTPSPEDSNNAPRS